MVNLKKLKFLIPIIIIIIVSTIGYMLVYAHNPFSEVVSVFNSIVGESVLNNPAPEIQGIEHWINSEPVSVNDFKGSVILVDFWTYGCINCQRAVPHVIEMHKRYKDQGLIVIGVHTPEFRHGGEIENVEREVANYGIEYPVAMDNNYKTWRAYNNHYWPAVYLIDKAGNVVYRRFGEGGYEQTEAKIKELLAQ